MKYPFALLFSVLLSACSTEPTLTKKWTIDGVKVSTLLQEYDESFNALRESAVKFDFFFRFYPDGSFTAGSNRSALLTGSWALTNQDLTLDIAPFGKTMRFKVQELSKTQLTLQLHTASRRVPNDGSRMPRLVPQNVLLSGAADNYDFSEKSDYYSLRLNAWRVKATQRESEAQLRERLLNHLDYLIAYLGVTIDREGGEVDLSELASPITMARNGIGLKFFDDSEVWAASFFDQRDAKLAHGMLARAIRRYYPAFQAERPALERELKGEHSNEVNRGLAFFKAYLERLRERISRSGVTT